MSGANSNVSNSKKNFFILNFATKTGVKDTKQDFYRPNGLHWITAALFIVADMAGGGVVAMPIAMLKTGGFVGGIVIILIATSFCYTAHLLGENWLLMCERWPEMYGGSAKICEDLKIKDNNHNEFAHCRKPYPEMAYRSMGHRVRVITSLSINVMLYGISIVYLLLASKIISDFLGSAFNIHVGQCSMLLIVSISLLPVTFLKSPQDFWWAVVTAMITTAVSVVFILVGIALDAPFCAPKAAYLISFQGDQFLLSLGIFMFSFGGHGVFPTIQHDMKRPQQFTRSAVFAFLIVLMMYVPISTFGYHVYGNSLQDSIINSIQIPIIQIGANLCIAVHCILTLTIVINPLNQQFEHIFHIPHHFGWKRCAIRTGVMALVVFSAETVPSFGPILNLISGTGVALTSAIMPCFFYMFMNARYGRRIPSALTLSDNNIKKETLRSIFEPPVPTIMQVIRRTPNLTLFINMLIIVVAIMFGVLTTRSAFLEITSNKFNAPCYLSSSAFAQGNVVTVQCCGAKQNIYRYENENSTHCFLTS